MTDGIYYKVKWVLEIWKRPVAQETTVGKNTQQMRAGKGRRVHRTEIPSECESGQWAETTVEESVLKGGEQMVDIKTTVPSYILRQALYHV